MKATDFAPGDAVRYVPGYAHGNVRHADCEDGTVTRVDAEADFVFVAFDAHPQQPQACDPISLVKSASIPPAETMTQLADRIAKEWTDKGKLVEGGWLAYCATIGGGKSMDANTRQVWFLASEHLYSSIMGVLDEGDAITEKDMRRMALIHEELQAFRRSLVN